MKPARNFHRHFGQVKIAWTKIAQCKNCIDFAPVKIQCEASQEFSQTDCKMADRCGAQLLTAAFVIQHLEHDQITAGPKLTGGGTFLELGSCQKCYPSYKLRQ